MAFIPAPNCAEISLNFIEFDQRIQNVYHVVNTVPFDADSLDTVAGIFKTWHETYIAPTQSSSVGLASIIARALDSESAPAIEYVTGLPIVGEQTATPGLPANVTVAVKWLTGLRGRSFRGRTFHIGLCEDMVSGNKVNEAVVASLLGAYGTLIVSMALTTFHPCVLSKYHLGAPRTTAVATEIISCAVDEWVDSQRRRLTGRGQ